MSRIYIMRFISSIFCTITCDNMLIGKTEGGELSAAIPQGEHLFTFTPLPEEGYALPISMFIDISRPKSCPQGILLKILPEGELICEISFFVIKKRIPCILSSASEEGSSAAVFYDQGVNVSFESEFGRSVLRVCDDCEKAEAFITNGFFFAAIDETCVYSPVNAPKSASILKNTIYTGEELITRLPHPDGILLKTAVDGKRELLLPKSDSLLHVSLAYCVLYGFKEEAEGLLSPSLLRSIGFEELCEFFGNDFSVDVTLCTEKKLALDVKLRPRIYEVHFLDVELSGRKISNLNEK